MKLTNLLAQLDRDETYNAATKAARPQANLSVKACAGIRPPFVASVSARNDLTVVVLPSGRDAEQFAHALADYVPQVAVFPSWETLPHERLSPRLDTMAARASVIARLSAQTGQLAADAVAGQLEPIKVLVTSVRGWLQPVIASIGQVPWIQLVPGQEVGFEETIEKLVDLGYRRQDMVANRGDFAVRGGLIDIFPPLEDSPVRIEFFGDEVDEVRYFSLTDQRSTETVKAGILLGPCRELLLTDKVKDAAGKAYEKLPGVEDLLEQIQAGAYVEGMESLAPVLDDSMQPLANLLPDNSVICVCDPEVMARRATDLQATTDEFMAAAWEAAAAGGQVPVSAQAASFAQLGELRRHCVAQGNGWISLSDFLTGSEDAEDADLAAFFASADTEYDLGARDVEPYRGDFKAATSDLGQLIKDGWKLLLTTQGDGSAKRMADALGELGLPSRQITQLPAGLNDPVIYTLGQAHGRGFVLTEAKLAVFTEADLTGRKATTAPSRSTRVKRKVANAISDPLALKPGDYIVHDQHGVGKFLELVSRTTGRGASQVTRDYLLVEYAPSKRGGVGDRLFVPTDSLDRISKYSGSDAPALSKMGGADWEKTKAKARKAVKEIASELVRLYAARSASKGFAFSPDTPWQQELEDAFEYPETPDQLTTIAEVKADMEKPYPMDRLLCGDVGYGKTEVAVRAAFKAIQDGKQVAVLCPTTLLAQQHLETFRQRFVGFPVTVASLSRFTSTKEAEEIKTDLLAGKIDLVIGTHSLVTGQVRFKDLGLVIIDEEQRFGVEHKETLKQLRANVDVLSMSATPIPRTLEMAVTGIRQMSMLQTPPEERHPVLTYVGRWQDKQMVAAIKRELMRDGQVFFVHNKVSDIDAVAAKITELIPSARVRVAHGKMGEQALEKVIVDFWNREFDVLVCTTIVETGLDIANANTLIVDRADQMGLSQLHQLRGRVGRSRERAYAYFFYPSDKVLTETAHERLKTIATHTDLGAGMAVAMKDLEIRGAGNLLGGAQSGHIAGVGFDLYVRMVAEAVADFKGEHQEEKPEVKVDLPIEAHIPPAYIPGERLRLETYAKIASANDEAELSQVRAELVDRYGQIPTEVERLFVVAKLRQQIAAAGLTEVASAGPNLRFAPITLGAAQAARLRRLYPGAVQKPALRQVLIPAPKTAKMGGNPVVNEDLATWVANVVEHIFAWDPTASDD
ncbi:transcription-repair coupling factor [Boudabousia tangfeifanii]|uniref:Transcription-repair-coupling factor n=1 Tax=Boudabousia tangfeifanii TaxID=1912795 RepID=A0A1D9MLC6_9ACTO|nr:transcription-repair coupling factor [Boudabousia tangfeifanii]AOZ72960.1 transcription-repair coupling factor [Boudabousia tangfeifanii]